MHGDKSKSEGRIPAKVFEYLAARKPILAYGQYPGDVAKIVENAKAGHFIPFDEIDQLKQAIRQLFVAFNNGSAVEPTGLAQYERKELTRQMAALLDTIT